MLFNLKETSFLKSLRPLAELTAVEKCSELGRNVIANEIIPAGTLIGIYPGAKLSLNDYYDKHELLNQAIKYGYRLSEDTIIDPTDIFGYLEDRPENRIALINEATPTKRSNILPLASKNNIWYLVFRKVQKGEPLFSFYGTTYTRDYECSNEESKTGVQLSLEEKELLKNVSDKYCWLENEISELLS